MHPAAVAFELDADLLAELTELKSGRDRLLEKSAVVFSALKLREQQLQHGEAAGLEMEAEPFVQPQRVCVALLCVDHGAHRR